MRRTNLALALATGCVALAGCGEGSRVASGGRDLNTEAGLDAPAPMPAEKAVASRDGLKQQQVSDAPSQPGQFV